MNRKRNCIAIVLLSLCLIVAGGGLSVYAADSTTVKVKVTGEEWYSYSFKALTLVNKERKAAGLDPVTMDKDLLETAMKRAYELALKTSHTRPNGKDCTTAGSTMFAENLLAGAADASSAVGIWMGSSVHRANILGKEHKSVGIGCVPVQNSIYWIQCFSDEEASTPVTKSSYKDKKKTRTVTVKKSSKYYKPSLYVTKSTIKKGKKAYVVVKWNNGFIKEILYPTNAVIKSSNKSIFTVKNGVIKAKKKGKAKLIMYYPGYKSKKFTKTIKVK